MAEESRIKLTATSVLREVALGCWREVGGTEETEEPIQVKNYSALLTKVTGKLYPESELSSSQVILLWNEMKELALSKTEGSARFFVNPNSFDWDTSKPARYAWYRKWLDEKAATEAEVVPKAEVVSEEPQPPEPLQLKDIVDIVGQELAKAQARLLDREQIIQALTGEAERCRKLIADLEESIELFESLQELERKKIELLQPKEEGSTDEAEQALPVPGGEELAGQ